MFEVANCDFKKLPYCLNNQRLLGISRREE
jgi:hypothetical protein